MSFFPLIYICVCYWKTTYRRARRSYEVYSAAAEVVAPGKTIAREAFAGSEVSLAAPTVSRALDLAAPVAVFDEAFVAFVKLLVAHSAAQAQMRRGA